MTDTTYASRIPAGTVHYEDPSFHIFARFEKMRQQDNYHASPHWHDEIEIMHITEGCMYYDIDGKVYPVEKDDVIFINRARMHASFLKDSEECDFNIVLIHPSVYAGVPAVYQTMVNPILEGSNYPFFIEKDKKTAEAVDCIVQIQNTRQEGYQLAMISEAWNLMYLLYQRFSSSDHKTSSIDSRELELMTQMAAFIYKHYSEKIFLKEIADSASVSISTCSRLFQHYLKKSPIDFLNAYRLEVSSALLRSTDDSIGKISWRCGFDQQAYYSRMFKKVYGVTPAGYRRHPTDHFVH